jgi:hypothetical protein
MVFFQMFVKVRTSEIQYDHYSTESIWLSLSLHVCFGESSTGSTGHKVIEWLSVCLYFSTCREEDGKYNDSCTAADV